jgi:hypothetical protein
VAAVLPVLETVTVCAEDVLPTVTPPNDSEPGEAVTFGAAAAPPVPDSAIETLVPPLPVIVMLPPYACAAVGENVTLIVQLAPAPRLAGQLCVRANPAGAAPYVMPVAAPPPVLDTVMVWLPDDDPTVTVPNASDPGDAPTLGVAAGHCWLPARYQM